MDHPVCGLCGETSHELVSESVAEAPGSSIYRCGKCGIIYQFPIMSEEEEARFYASEFERDGSTTAGARADRVPTGRVLSSISSHTNRKESAGWPWSGLSLAPKPTCWK